MTPPVAMPAPADAALAASQGQRLIKRTAAIVFPQLTEALLDQGASSLESARQSAMTHILRMATSLYADARGLGECPFWPTTPDLPLPKDAIQAARAQLSCDASGEAVEFATLTVRCLGELYEQLLATDRNLRKAWGSFYTPQPMVAFIVQQTLAPACDQARECCVLDPAMGAGHFLLSATRYLAERLREREQPVCRTEYRFRQLMHQVATRCIYGIDLDPLAVQVARASLWLEVGLPDVSYEALNEHLRCGDALTGATSEGWPRFDGIVGNPPYGSQVDAVARKQLVKHLPQMKHNGDAAVGFVERSSQMLSARGRCGLVLPKPLTYSFAWRELRRFLGRRVEHVVDVSRAWPEVKLEQVIVVFGADASGSHYRTWSLNRRGFSPSTRLAWRWTERFGTLPCALSTNQRRLLDRLQLADATVGDIARTWRGLPLQSQLRPEGQIPVLGGRDLARWRVRSVSGYADTQLERSDAFGQPKLLFQNIIAHIANPQPHIRLIGAFDAAGHVTLDTVNNLSPREPGWPLEGLLALLHSRLVNWFVYRVIYNGAIRTMHFDQYFLDKIPLPREFALLWPTLAELARESIEIERRIANAQAQLAADLYAAAGVTLPERTLAGIMAGRETPFQQIAAPHQLLARQWIKQRAEIEHRLNCVVDNAYGAAKAGGDDEFFEEQSCMTS